MISELRSSPSAVSDSLHRLVSAGLIVGEAGIYRYQPVSAMLDRLVTEIEKLYGVKPVSVTKAIMSANNRTLQIFANSFKLKE